MNQTNELLIIDVIIPAYNEEESIGKVLNDLPFDLVREVIVCDNNSTDKTTEVAEQGGARVISATRQGYGSACLAGLDYIAEKAESPEVVVFLDGDYSDHPEQLSELISPIQDKNVEMVIGSRAQGKLEKGSMQFQQIFGNWLATTLIRLLYGYEFTDLGPFRAIRYDSLMKMDMQDKDFGWTVEMQVKAAKMSLIVEEVPVDYRRRIGVSKISGTLKGTLLAGHKILWTIFKLI